MPPSLLTFPGTMLLAVPAPAGATFHVDLFLVELPR
jgi:hypothetical protein